MIWAGRVALVAAAGFALVGSAAGQPLPKVSLSVSDHLSAGQLEETIAVYLAGVLVGTLHVDATHPDDSFQAQVPALAALPFALCGKLIRQEPDGGSSTDHAIDNGGMLRDYAGGHWAAITLGDVLFTLRDEAGQGHDDVARGPACSAAVS